MLRLKYKEIAGFRSLPVKVCFTAEFISKHEIEKGGGSEKITAKFALLHPPPPSQTLLIALDHFLGILVFWGLSIIFWAETKLFSVPGDFFASGLEKLHKLGIIDARKKKASLSNMH
jgi:hypothetical protein